MSKAFNIIQRGPLSILAINNGSIVYKAKTDSLNEMDSDFGDLVTNDYALCTIERGVILGAAPENNGYTVSVITIDGNGNPLSTMPEEFHISVDTNKLAKDVWCDEEGLVLALREKINAINNRQLQKLQQKIQDITFYIEKVKRAEAIDSGITNEPEVKQKTKPVFFADEEESNKIDDSKVNNFANKVTEEKKSND